MTSLIYDRLVDIHRLQTVAGSNDAIGDVGYSGAEQSTSSPAGEIVLFTGLPAKIQAGAAGRKKSTGLPTDAVYAPTWFIFIPSYAISADQLRDRDLVYDDQGYRYEVGQNYWSLFGYKLTAVRLEG